MEYAAGRDAQTSPLFLVLLGLVAIAAGAGALILHERGLALSRTMFGPMFMILIGMALVLFGLFSLLMAHAS